MAKRESILSLGVSPIPMSNPVVKGIPNSPAICIVFNLTTGLLLGANS